MQGHRHEGYGDIPWMCAKLYLVPHQGVRHFTIDHSHPYTNKARATYVMLARASTTSLASNSGTSTPEVADSNANTPR